MVNFLLFVSITLNLIAILSIVILYVRQNRFVDMEKEQKKNIEEMEEVIATFITEIKEENEQFIHRLHSIQSQGPNKIENHEEQSESALKDTSIDFKPRETKMKKAVLHAYKKPAPLVQEERKTEDRLEKEDINELLHLILPPEKEEKEKTTVEKALEMQAEGKSVEEIAKTLHKGKTEMELLLKFRQNS